MDIDRRLLEQEPPKTLWCHVRKVWREMNGARPVSFYLLGAILLALLLGTQIVYVRGNPKQYALFLCLNFVFFFVILFRALVDCIQIARRHFHERERLFHSTLGEEEFAVELGRSIARSAAARPPGDLVVPDEGPADERVAGSGPKTS